MTNSGLQMIFAYYPKYTWIIVSYVIAYINSYMHYDWLFSIDHCIIDFILHVHTLWLDGDQIHIEEITPVMDIDNTRRWHWCQLFYWMSWYKFFSIIDPLTPKLAKTGQYQICCISWTGQNRPNYPGLVNQVWFSSNFYI